MKNNMPDSISIITPAGREIDLYRISGATAYYDSASSVSRTAYLAAIGYALEMLGTDDDGELVDGERIYRECAMCGTSLYLGDFEGHQVLDLDTEKTYCIRSVDFIRSCSGPRCVLQVWDEDADTYAYYDN